MRISTSNSFSNSVRSLQQHQEAVTRAQEQMTSLKRVSKPSDDPIAAARAERALNEQTYGEQLQRSIDASKNVMTLTESTLGQAVDVLQSAREALVSAGDASYSSEQRTALAKQLEQQRKQLLSMANATDGAGGYLFAGQTPSVQPYSDAAPNGVTVNVGVTSGSVGGSNDEDLPLSINGPVIWANSANGGTDIFKTLDTAIAALQSGAAFSSSDVAAGLTGIDSAMSEFVNQRSQAGEVLNNLDNLTSRTADRILAAKTTRSNAEDLDMIEAASNFSQKQASYQAALQSYSMVQKLSLFNYINN